MSEGSSRRRAKLGSPPAVWRRFTRRVCRRSSAAGADEPPVPQDITLTPFCSMATAMGFPNHLTRFVQEQNLQRYCRTQGEGAMTMGPLAE